jgi:energy-coupling factor transporter ATP-binding protein EcfA2
MDPIYPVQTVDEAYHACHPDLALEAGDPRYIPLTSVRGGFDLPVTITNNIRRTPRGYFHQQLVTGHRGCGKSTELKRLQARLRETKYFAVYVDAEALLDLGDVTYLDVLVALTQELEQALRGENIRLPPSLRENLDQWFANVILTEEQRRDVERALEADFGVGPQVPALARMLAAITGQIRSGSYRRVEIRRQLEQNLRVFVQRLNELVDDARVRLTRKGWNDLVFIVDGLEKMHYAPLPDGQSTHSALFVAHAEQLKSIHSHVIYTVPISLVFNANLGDAFPDPTLIIPMVKITEPDGRTLYEPGRKALFQVVARRVDVAKVMESEDLVWRLVEASGGSVRDLMRLMRLACYGATDCIRATHVETAIRELGREYDRLMQDDDLDLLIFIAQERRVPGNERSARLLHLRLVLEYQDDSGRWANIHPALRLSPRLKDRVGA